MIGSPIVLSTFEFGCTPPHFLFKKSPAFAYRTAGGYAITDGKYFRLTTTILARPRLRPARCKDLKVALGAAPIGEAASLLRDRNFVKGPGHCPRVIRLLRLGFRFLRALQVVWESETLRLRGPADRILEK